VDDVRLAVNGRAPVAFYGRMGGVVPLPDEILGAIQKQVAQAKPTHRQRHMAEELYEGRRE
jgi:2-oxoglutarate ferredoxin oxidoreductase subunit alpha